MNRLDGVLALLLFFFALALRLPYITLVPPLWNTEIAEASDAAEIAWGHSLPLVLPSQPHIGPVAAYPLALVLRLIGFDPFVPRLFVAVIGALTVVAAFLLARTMGGRLGAVIAATLLATSSFHILINSHVFWTNSITPFLTTVALTALTVSLASPVAGQNNRRPVWFVLAFVLWGLALQSHPSVWTLLPGLVLALALQPSLRSNWRRAWTWVAPAAGLLAYSNIILFNLTSGFASISALRTKYYALPEEQLFWRTFPARLQEMGDELLRVVTSNLPEAFALEPRTFALTVWLALALVQGVRKQRSLLLYPAASAALFIAIFNKAYNLAYVERYIMFLAPIVFVLMGLAVEDGWAWFRKQPLPRLWMTGGSLAALGAIIVLVLFPLPALMSYVDREIQAGRSNKEYLPWVEFARQYAGSGYRVVISPELDQSAVVLNAGGVGTTIAYLFAMNGTQTQLAPPEQLVPSGQNRPVTKFVMNLFGSGFEERQRTLAVCVMDDKTQRVLTIYPDLANECKY